METETLINEEATSTVADDKKATKWTEEQIERLHQLVSESKTKKQAYRTLSEEIGKSVGTISQKHYNLTRKNSKNTQKPSIKNSSKNSKRNNLSKMSVIELSILIKDAKSELANRAKTIEQQRAKQMQIMEQELNRIAELLGK